VVVLKQDQTLSTSKGKRTPQASGDRFMKRVQRWQSAQDVYGNFLYTVSFGALRIVFVVLILRISYVRRAN